MIRNLVYYIVTNSVSPDPTNTLLEELQCTLCATDLKENKISFLMKLVFSLVVGRARQQTRKISDGNEC